MAEKVGELYYQVDLDTGKMIAGQRAVDKELGKTTASLDKFQFKVTAVAAGVAILAAAMATVKSAQMADEMRLLVARVNVAAGSIKAGAEAMRELQAISQRTQTSIEANADVFGRLNQSLLQMGGTQQDTLRLTELLGMAIKVSGASANEAKAAMLQFGQALGSGKLAGDELRSLLETAPYLMQQLAAGIGVPVGALKQLGEDGKLTADVVVAAMGKAAGKIEADFATFPQTIGGAMNIIEDNAQRANLSLDNMTGASAKLAGVAQGLGTVIGELADQFEDATDESDKLGRNDEVKSWAQTTANILSYVVDAADGVVRSVRQVGLAIGGLAAAGAAVLRGELGESKAIIKEMQADSEKLWMTQLAGEKIRARIASGGGTRAPAAPFSALKAPSGGDGKKKKAGAKFDSAGYLGGLESQAVEGFAKVDAVEQEALRKNADLLAKKKITAEESARAIAAIQQRAAKDRLDLQQGLDQKISDLFDDAAKKEIEQEKDREENRQAARRDIAALDPLEAIRVEEEERLAIVEANRQLDLQNTQLYEDQKLAIQRDASLQREEILQREIDMQDRNNAMSLAAMTDLAGNVYSLLEKAGKERTALGKAAFLASKALAVAEIIMSTEVAAAKAGAQLGIYGIPMQTLIRATGYASAGLVAGMAIGEVAGGRQYGGPVSSGSLYRVNEGGAPEMFTGSNGSQYMLPTKSGQVTPADQVGAGGGWTFIVNNNAPGVSVSEPTVDQQTRTITMAVSEVASQISNNSGPVWTAMRGSTNVKGRM